MKTIKWNSKAKEFVKQLSIETKKEIGALLLLLQRGVILQSPQSKLLKAIHKNAFELRMSDKKGSYRVIYIFILKGTIFIPHAFQKKTQRTPKKEINLAQARIKELKNEN